ncbi:hypothetical protein SERLA73DRAFT_148548 [Serpula lacrymans var. lacrymans S7.3]|uniref:Uncharacterized protein n=1 Tax=Serpula lacrymans var. lacrymans (strain S7.3) TaxID=936435 RepID=F8QJX0_SERL3|nr:hypothetical protein SERLA73DRAFT_148548 [Serpula lacrymans var. lacrymans S7.3]
MGYSGAPNDNEVSYEKWRLCLHSNQCQHQVGEDNEDQSDEWNEDLHFQLIQ